MIEQFIMLANAAFETAVIVFVALLYQRMGRIEKDVEKIAAAVDKVGRETAHLAGAASHKERIVQ